MTPDGRWIWGRHPVLEALRAGEVTSILLARSTVASSIVTEIKASAHELGVAVREVTAEDIFRIAGTRSTQGIAAQVRAVRRVDLDVLLENKGTENSFILVLDQIQDPQNFGALLRTADAAGVQGIVVPARRTAPLAGATAKASAGALSHLTVCQVPNLARAIGYMREKGVWIVGLDASANLPLFGTDLTVPLALVIGSEASGMRHLTRELCDFLVSVPMRGHVASLNASAAGAVAMYEVVRQRAATIDSSRATAPT